MLVMFVGASCYPARSERETCKHGDSTQSGRADEVALLCGLYASVAVRPGQVTPAGTTADSLLFPCVYSVLYLAQCDEEPGRTQVIFEP